MSRRDRSLSSSLIGQSSVALADILANSVAVILILIAVTLTVQQRKAQEELEKNADLTTILARQLASNIVFNDLPSSPPARLHDYHSCAIPHDCNPMLYPILELSNGHVRVFNTNTRIYRNELLRENNALDQYLQTLTPKEKLNIRLDVHHVTDYYLAMAILKENGINPRHWHYLGEHTRPLKNKFVKEGSGKRHGKTTNSTNTATTNANGTVKEITSDNGQGQQGDHDSNTPSNAAQLLNDTQLADADAMGNLNYDSLLPPTENNAPPSPDSTQSSGSGGEGQSGNAGDPNAQPSNFFDALMGMMAESRGVDLGNGTGSGTNPGGGQGQSGNRTMKLRIPNTSGQTGQQDGGEGNPVSVDSPTYNRLVLAYLFELLKTARTERSLALEQAGDILSTIILLRDDLPALPNAALVETLATQLEAGVAERYPTLGLTTDPNLTQNQLATGVNQPLPEQQLLLHQPTPWLDDLSTAEAVQPTLLLRLYPTLFKGERLDFPKGFTLLLHPDEFKHPKAQWRPIAVVDPTLEDPSMGFVFSSIKDNQLIIHGGVNQLQLNQRLIANPLLSESNQRQKHTPFFWLSTLFLLLGVLALQRFIRSPKPTS